MPLEPGNSRAVVSKNISELTHHGSRPRSRQQIIAIALSNADRHPHRADGGAADLFYTPPVNSRDYRRDPLSSAGNPPPPKRQEANPEVTGTVAGNRKVEDSDLRAVYRTNIPFAAGGSNSPSEHLAEKIDRLQRLETENAVPDTSGTFYRRLLENGGGEPIPLRASGGGIGSVHMMPMHGIGANLNSGHEGSSHGIAPSMQTPWWTKAAAHQMTAPPRGGGIGFAAGGMSASQESPWWERSAASQAIHDHPFGGGYLNYAGAGRTDQLPLAVATDSHVLPADSLSGAGQDHSLAGARIMALATGVGPMGIPLKNLPHGHGPPAPPHAAATSNNDISTHLAGGGKGEKTSILAAGGEMVLPPWYVQFVGEWGQKTGEGKSGETVMDTGHRLIDRAIMRIRKFHIDFLKTAPKPKKAFGGAV